MFAFAFFVRCLWISFFAFARPSVTVDLWCGKAYKEGDPIHLPTGMIQPPTISPVLLLDVSIRPRKNFYLEDEKDASFIVDAKASYIHGEPYKEEAKEEGTDLHATAKRLLRPRADDINLNATDEQQDLTTANNRGPLTLSIRHADTGRAIVPTAGIAFNETNREYSITLASFEARLAPHPITIEMRKRDGTTFHATTTLSYLPIPRIPQSYSRIDSLTNAIEVRSNGPHWETIFPYSFYLSGEWLASAPGNLRRFREWGYNILHVVPGGGGAGYDLVQMDKWVEEAEKLGLWIMFDMRWTYQDEGFVKSQVERYKRRGNMLLWYTADEPDGHENPPDAPSKAYKYIKSLDPYHPISLCLNCQNYHFEQYSAGADILLADVYPIGTNTEYSTKYHTPCTSTHGDCGCDNCHTAPTSPTLANIPSRLSLWRTFSEQLGLPPKPIWSVPQAFTAQDFWTRTPTPEEVVAQALLAVNHGATGVVMWNFPTAEEIVGLTRQFAKVVTGRDVERFWLRARGKAVGVKGAGAVGRVDAVSWRVRGEILVSVVSFWDEGVRGDIRLVLQDDVRVKGVGRTLWGSGGGWKFDGERGVVRTGGMKGAESSIFLVEVEDVG